VAGEGLALPADSRVSRKHAELRVLRGQTVLVDWSSTGTFVNGQRLGGRCALESGDLIRIGDSVLLYRAEPEPEGHVDAHGLLGDSPALRRVRHTLDLGSRKQVYRRIEEHALDVASYRD
jgi:pSer/pThr/pTyr-binding forkhead associated (FHA) protein